jgi:SAM-dependent methyltransferase
MKKKLQNLNLNEEVNMIRKLSRTVLKKASPDSEEYSAAKRAIKIPIEYMRYAEFYALLNSIDLKKDTRILDIGSPQWFSLILAVRYPEVQFVYTNILEGEITPFKRIAELNEIRNISYKIEDVRKLSYPDCSFETVISISVIEHIYPAKGGDEKAFIEIDRVLKKNGKLLLTIPFKEKGNVLYQKGAVYERNEQGNNFFAREYDRKSFEKLLAQSKFDLEKKFFISEKQGLLSLDYCLWGEGRGKLKSKIMLFAYKVFERITPFSLEEKLARKYLVVSEKIQERVVNMAAILKSVE